MLKAELHTHTSDDPCDFVPHDNHALIDRAAALGYDVLAITLHDRQLDIGHLTAYARQRGVVLMPGIERTIHGKHVLLINFPAEAELVTSFDDVRRLKARSNGLVIAPHPFFPAASCLRGLMDAHAELFDAVEINAFFTPTIDFNARARRWAVEHGKPLVGNGDVHRLAQLGTTWSLIDAPPDPEAICDAIRRGRVTVRARPISVFQAARHLTSLLASDLLGPFGKRTPATAPSYVIRDPGFGVRSEG